MYQPKFSRLTSRYVRRELMRLLRRKYLPLLARHVQYQPADSSAWTPLKTVIDVSSLRTGIEAMAALPTARREPKPKGCEYERQLKVWKRRRTIARGKVAKYARLVRYHKKPGKNSPQISDRWGAGRDMVSGQRVRAGHSHERTGMNNDSRNMAARCAMLLAQRIDEIRNELRDDPAYEECGADPMIVGLLLVLCNSVMHEGNWSQRGLLFEAFSGCKWPAGVTVRKRLEEVLDGLNLRDDHWRFN